MMCFLAIFFGQDIGWHIQINVLSKEENKNINNHDITFHYLHIFQHLKHMILLHLIDFLSKC